MSIKNGDLPAMPVIEETKTEQYNGGTYTTAQAISLGLTKREQFAMAAMQGMLANGEGYDYDADLLAKYSVINADALLAELEKSK